MDFGEMLELWESQKASGRSSRPRRRQRQDDFSKQFERHLFSQDSWEQFLQEKEDAEEDPAARRRRLRAMAPEAHIDLHGMTAQEARKALDEFLKEACRRSLRKVLIIHGKGNHSGEHAVLPGLVRHYLQSSPICGESGRADKTMGGSGATWLILKQ